MHHTTSIKSTVSHRSFQVILTLNTKVQNIPATEVTVNLVLKNVRYKHLNKKSLFTESNFFLTPPFPPPPPFIEDSLISLWYDAQ